MALLTPFAVLLSSLALAAQVAGPTSAPTWTDPNSPGISVTAVTPRSLAAGSGFKITIRVPRGYDQPVRVAVFRQGLNIRQYQSNPIRDNDAGDSSLLPGIIEHTVGTSGAWTSIASPGGSNLPVRYLVMIDEPMRVQLDQMLSVTGRIVSVSTDVLRELMRNLEQGLANVEGITTLPKQHVAIVSPPNGGTGPCGVSGPATWNFALFICPPASAKWNAPTPGVYARTLGALWAMDYDTPALKDSKGAWVTSSPEVAMSWFATEQARAVSEEGKAVDQAFVALPVADPELAKRWSDLKTKAGALGIKW